MPLYSTARDGIQLHSAASFLVYIRLQENGGGMTMSTPCMVAHHPSVVGSGLVQRGAATDHGGDGYKLKGAPRVGVRRAPSHHPSPCEPPCRCFSLPTKLFSALQSWFLLSGRRMNGTSITSPLPANASVVSATRCFGGDTSSSYAHTLAATTMRQTIATYPTTTELPYSKSAPRISSPRPVSYANSQSTTHHIIAGILPSCQSSWMCSCLQLRLARESRA